MLMRLCGGEFRLCDFVVDGFNTHKRRPHPVGVIGGIAACSGILAYLPCWWFGSRSF